MGTQSAAPRFYISYLIELLFFTMFLSPQDKEGQVFPISPWPNRGKPYRYSWGSCQLHIVIGHVILTSIHFVTPSFILLSEMCRVSLRAWLCRHKDGKETLLPWKSLWIKGGDKNVHGQSQHNTGSMVTEICATWWGEGREALLPSGKLRMDSQ